MGPGPWALGRVTVGVLSGPARSCIICCSKRGRWSPRIHSSIVSIRRANNPTCKPETYSTRTRGRTMTMRRSDPLTADTVRTGGREARIRVRLTLAMRERVSQQIHMGIAARPWGLLDDRNLLCCTLTPEASRLTRKKSPPAKPRLRKRVANLAVHSSAVPWRPSSSLFVVVVVVVAVVAAVTSNKLLYTIGPVPSCTWATRSEIEKNLTFHLTFRKGS